ncbi:MAG: hypothetical protein ABI871_04065 [Chthoniobacterales bacterium]
MKTNSTRYRRTHLLPIPYSTRPDRLARSLRIVRALRRSLEAPVPIARPRQVEFKFVLPPRRA